MQDLCCGRSGLGCADGLCSAVQVCNGERTGLAACWCLRKEQGEGLLLLSHMERGRREVRLLDWEERLV